MGRRAIGNLVFVFAFLVGIPVMFVRSGGVDELSNPYMWLIATSFAGCVACCGPVSAYLEMKPESSKIVAVVFALLFIVLLAVFVWPTPWSYMTVTQANVPARANRVTGRVEILAPDSGQWTDYLKWLKAKGLSY